MDALKPTPILLFGMPRSGTTWLGKVFDSHPCTLYRHEPDSGGALDNLVPVTASAEHYERYQEPVSRFVRDLPANRSLKVTGKLPVFGKTYQPPMAHHARHGMLVAAKGLSRWVSVPGVPEFVRKGYEGPLFLVWKSIESLGRLGVIARAVPQARAVHIVRHPCGYVSSVLSGEASGMMPGALRSSEDYGIFDLLLQTSPARRRGLSREYLESLEPLERLAWRWVLYNEKAQEDLDGLSNATTVLYEDLCADPAGGYRRLFDFAGLSWASQTEAFVNASTQQEKSAYFSVFKNPLRAAGSWRERLSSVEQQQIMGVVAGSRPGALYGV